MTNIKKQVYNDIIRHMENDLSAAQRAIVRNKYELKKLAETQTKLKRSRGILVSLIRDIKEKQ